MEIARVISNSMLSLHMHNYFVTNGKAFSKEEICKKTLNIEFLHSLDSGSDVTGFVFPWVPSYSLKGNVWARGTTT